MAKTFPNLWRDLVTQVHEATVLSHNFNPKQFCPRYIIINLSKIKDEKRILKSARENKFVTCKVYPSHPLSPPAKVISRFHSRNPTDQDKVGDKCWEEKQKQKISYQECDIQHSCLQKLWRDKEFLIQTKAEGANHY